MAVNKHFHTSGAAAIASEQNLYKDLVTEAIQIYGHDVYYLDRTLVAEDTVWGEDSLSKFNTQAPIEMYMEDAEGGYAGERELMSQFGLQNLSEATFVVSKSRFQDKTKQIQIETGTDSTSSGSILLEAGSLFKYTDAGDNILMNGTDGISSNAGDEILLDRTHSDGTDAGDSILMNGTAVSTDLKLEGSTFYIISETAATDSDRPLEGDVIYHPTLGKLFEINFVDHDEPFYQLDNNPVYKMRCRLFEYSSEVLDTGITAIDEIEDDLSRQALIYQFTLEQSSAVNEDIRLEWGVADAGLVLEETDGDNIVGENDSSSVGESIILENGSYLLNESYIVGDFDQDKTAQNELFDLLDDTILDFSERNPFGDAGSL
jgi:hypothetical protein